MFRFVLIICIGVMTLVHAKSFGEWTVKGNSKYRFAEQYGKQDVRKSGERYVQRLDFTFSKKKGWEMTLTTSFLATKEDSINLIIDDEKYSFKGQEGLHKQEFPVNEKFIKKIMNTKNDLIIEEIYRSDEYGDSYYRSVFSSKGSYAALL